MSDDKWLETILMNEANYIDDDGFTDALMSKLPPRTKKVSVWFEPVIVSVATLLSLVAAIWVIPGFEGITQKLIQQMLGNSFVFIGSIFIAASAGLTGLSCLIGSSEA